MQEYRFKPDTEHKRYFRLVFEHHGVTMVSQNINTMERWKEILKIVD